MQWLIFAGIFALAWWLDRRDKRGQGGISGRGRRNPHSPSFYDKRCPEGMQVQSMLLPKARFAASEARVWLREHGMQADDLDEGKRFFRARQRPPGAFRYFRIRRFEKDVKNPIMAVVGCPKE